MDVNKHTVLLFSGGLDSTVALYLLRERGWEVSCLSVDYGQPHKRELDAAKSIEPATRVVTTEFMPMNAHEGPDSAVPGRNLVLLALGVSYAQRIGATHVALAAQRGDAAVYPDCRRSFFERATLLTSKVYGVATWGPLLDMHRSLIVQRGAQLGVPFEKTWSCYVGGSFHCGDCGACKSRRAAFLAAPAVDPVEYE